MDDQGHHYLAFVSYWHTDENAWWARRVHSWLESYSLPKSVRGKLGLTRRRLGRCFLDRSEVAASSDLGADIRDALARAGSLVVICSPETPKSAWVTAEVDEFLRLGRRDRIFLLLVRGELSESCPPSLYEPPTGGATVLTSRMPLAADVRGAGRFSRRRRQALIRLVAGIVGIDFDALWRREQRRRWRRRAAAAILAVALLLTSLVVIAETATPQLVVERTTPHALGENGLIDLPPFVAATLGRDGGIGIGGWWQDDVVYYVDPRRRQPVPLKGLGGYVVGLFFSGDGRSLIGIAQGMTCWDVRTLTARWAVASPAGATFCAVAKVPGADQILVADTRGRVSRVGFDGTVTDALTLDSSQDRIESIDVRADRNEVLLCQRETGLGTYAMRERAVKPVRVGIAATSFVNARWVSDQIVFSVEEESNPGSRVTDKRSVYVCAADGSRVKRLESSSNMYSGLFPIAGTSVCLIHNDSGTVSVWDVRSARQLALFVPHPLALESRYAAYYDDANRVLCTATRYNVCTWRLQWTTFFGVGASWSERWHR